MFYVIVGVLVAIAVFFTGWNTYKRVSESKVVSAERLAEKIVREAQKEAETRKKSALLEAKDEWYKAKAKFEQETQSTRQQLQALERRLADKDGSLNRRADLLERKERDVRRTERHVQTKEKAVEERNRELGELIREENSKLERIAGLSAEEAKQLLMSNLESEARHEAARLLNEIRETALRDAEKEVRKILTLAIQRCAAEHVVESTVSVVSLPSDEMKGRIIGREGRNIRAFETSTGIDVIIDYTPEAVILSGFDPIRREVARMSLEKLISDGRIHPGRIEEVVSKTQREMEEQIRETGEQTCLEVGIHGLHPELVKLLGRLRYRTSYGQNVLEHSKEVAFLAGMMASELGLDVAIAKRSGLLHDIGKAADHEAEGTHAQIGRELSGKYGEVPTVVDAVGGHHDDPQPDSLMAVLIQAADAVSGARPGARRETLETYVKRLEKLERIADSFPGVGKAYAIQAGREIRIMVEHKEVDDAKAAALASDIAAKVERELEYPGQIKIVVIRETRAVDYAK
ncbi:MAG: ribonuclease Y [Candidatus Eiseniibacteriota bacterium]|nr:MAG: ribonuclease Y [Candidatus Eisenbacteria bacterium]